MFQIGQKVNQQDEKIVNISRLVKLLQSYSDAQEEDNANLKAKVARLEDKVENLGGASQKKHNTSILKN